MYSKYLFIVASLLASNSSWSLFSERPLVRIFVLVGDDNVEGYASIPHLHTLATNANTRKKYKHLIEDDGIRWKTRDDVFVAYDHKRDKKLTFGPLSVQGFGKNPNTFGPEVGIGHVLGDLFEEPVILIKAGWSGRSLYKDFQAPSEDHPGSFQWFRLMASLTETVESLEEILGPKYKKARHEFSGLLWWHGYSDLELKKGVKKAKKAYPDLMKHWFHTIRSKIKIFLPIVVAEMGGQGTKNVSQVELDFRKMQKDVVSDGALRRNTVLVPTAPFVKKNADEKPGSEEIDSYEHYYGRADTMLDIGHALGVSLAKQSRGGARLMHFHGSGNAAKIGVLILAMLSLCFGAAALVFTFRKQLFSRSERKEIEKFLMSPFTRKLAPDFDDAASGEIEALSYRD